MNTTAGLLDHLTTAVEMLAQDHSNRVVRIESRRQYIAEHEASIMRALDRLRAAVDDLERAVRDGLGGLARLEDDELAHTDAEAQGETPPPPPPEGGRARADQFLLVEGGATKKGRGAN